MARLSKLRGNESYKRKQGRKTPRSITIIVCEGETEQEYFEAARIKIGLSTTEIVLAENTKGPAPISVVMCAEEKAAEPGGYDKIFCVFDRDGHESFDRSRERIKQLSTRKKTPLPIQEAISIPCFEVWVLLHLEKTDAPFTRCDNVIERIRVHMAGYEKASQTVANQLMNRVDAAVENANWLEARAANNNFNPYTSVHHILRHMKEVADK
jgi:hypothetical protein